MRASYSYTLDAASRLTSETQTWASGASSDTIGYTYTNNNQLTGVSHTNGAFASESFSFDANGNRNSTGYSTSTGNELSSDGTYNYTYDANGNETSRTNISTGVETVYKWDFRNRLTEVDSVVSGVSTVLASYTYDALDRRIGVSEGGSTTWTLYDGNAPILDFNGSGTKIARYMDGPTPSGVDEVLARETSGGVAWYLEDRLGSVGDIVDNSGALIDHIAYSAFGNVLSESSPSNGDRFKYAGLQYDAAVGLNFALHRVEDPTTGRWLSQDPIGFGAGDANLYRYVTNRSNYVSDPQGLTPNQHDADNAYNQLIDAIQQIEAKLGPNATPADVLWALKGSQFGYVYTNTLGWIDLQHFINSAQGGLFNPTLSFLGGLGVEMWQSLGYLYPWVDGVGSSAWTSEDVPSDYAGAYFGANLPLDCPLSTSLQNFFKNELGGVGTDPNLKLLPKTEEAHEQQWWDTYMNWLTYGFYGRRNR